MRGSGARTKIGVAAAGLAAVAAALLAAAPEAQGPPAGRGEEFGLILPVPPARRAEGFQAEVNWVRGADLLELRDGRKIRLQGVSLATPCVRPPDQVEKLKDYLKRRCDQKSLWIEPEDRVEKGDAADWCAVVRERKDAPSINEEVLELGLALYDGRTPHVSEAERLLAAAKRAQRAKAGWFAGTGKRSFGPGGPVPYLNGAVMGLYERDGGKRYRPHIEELAAAGFKHVEFLFSAMLENVKGSRIDRHHRRTVSDPLLIDSIECAKSHGMSVMLLPIVLLDEQTPDDWRGVLAPTDEEAFWRSYDAMLCHYLDIAEKHGVEIFSIGSELGSLEDRSATWRRLVQNARGRFTGLLTYSANWDHVHVANWFGELDLIGMTAYFSLTEKKDPTLDELEAGWRTAAAKLEKDLGELKLPRPVFFTELGYASQNGINTNPWNYYLAPSDVDVKEQAECFEAFLRVAPKMRFLSGAYLFDYFEEGGPTDSTYSPRDKPAMAQWKKWAAR